MIFTPAFTSVAYTDEYQAEMVADELKRRGYRTIGWVGSGAMPHKFVARIERELDGKAKFVDATEMVDRLKAIKSKEEQELIRKCALMQDEIFARVLAKIQPRNDAAMTSPRWRNTRVASSAASRGCSSARRRRWDGRRASSTAMSRRGRFSPASISRC